MQANSASYPATLTFDPPEKVANWRPLVNWLLAIPHFVVLYGLNLLSRVIGIVSWFIIVFTGALPEGLANMQVMYMRYSTRTNVFAAFLKEEYPPFTFSTTPADPGDDTRVRIDITPQLANRNRLTVAFRIILVIPQVVVLVFLFLASAVSVLISFFAVLFTGRWPDGLRDFVIKVMRWGLRVQAYFLLLTDEYPPFALD